MEKKEPEPHVSDRLKMLSDGATSYKKWMFLKRKSNLYGKSTSKGVILSCVGFAIFFILLRWRKRSEIRFRGRNFTKIQINQSIFNILREDYVLTLNCLRILTKSSDP